MRGRGRLLRAREGEQRTGEESLAVGEDLVADFGKREEIYFFFRGSWSLGEGLGEMSGLFWGEIRWLERGSKVARLEKSKLQAT